MPLPLPSYRFCFLSLGSLMLLSLVCRVSPVGSEYLTSSKASTCHNMSLELIFEAMNRLTDVTSSPGPHWNESETFKIRRALELLQHVSGIAECSTLDTKQRYLGEDGHNDDENYLQYDDVKVTYDSDNDTVVTVGEDVIVVVDHGVYHYVFNSIMLLLCIAVGALMSGLLMGVMTLEPLMLGIKSRQRTPLTIGSWP
ncbi:hypothetical protein MHU86_15701 [Fragilaria crotonensis]|nr:hypothetical protein MHU86_15701 [Fragilaria crotonensis]